METKDLGFDSAILKHRAKHDMLVIENVRCGTRTIAARVVIAPDRRVINDLEESGLWGAFKSISEAIKIRTQGLGARTFDPSRVSGQSSADDGADLLIRYDRWVLLCKSRYYSPMMVLDMVVDGLSFRAIDKKRHFLQGTAKKNMWKCLAVWDEV